MHDQLAAVVENKPLTGGHFLLSLEAPVQARATRPGQFAMVRLLGHDDVILRRPMSIYDVTSVNSGNGRGGGAVSVLQLLYKVVGRGTALMAELKPGDRVGLLAPLGHGFFHEEYAAQVRDADEVLHVAGGIGIAALLLPARSLAKSGVRQKLFFGGRTQWDLVGLDDFEPLTPSPVLATEDGSRGHHGYVTQPMEAYLRENPGKKFLIMACGPWAMLDATVRFARAGGHSCLVSMENRMGCGLSVCLGCCIRVVGEGHSAYQRVCTEGPVFWSDRVVWEKEDIPKI